MSARPRWVNACRYLGARRGRKKAHAGAMPRSRGPHYAHHRLPETRPGSGEPGSERPPALGREAPTSAQIDMTRIADLPDALHVIDREIVPRLGHGVDDRARLADRIPDAVALQGAAVAEHDLDPLDPFRALEERHRSGLFLAN